MKRLRLLVKQRHASVFNNTAVKNINLVSRRLSGRTEEVAKISPTTAVNLSQDLPITSQERHRPDREFGTACLYRSFVRNSGIHLPHYITLCYDATRRTSIGILTVVNTPSPSSPVIGLAACHGLPPYLWRSPC